MERLSNLNYLSTKGRLRSDLLCLFDSNHGIRFVENRKQTVEARCTGRLTGALASKIGLLKQKREHLFDAKIAFSKCPDPIWPDQMS